MKPNPLTVRNLRQFVVFPIIVLLALVLSSCSQFAPQSPPTTLQIPLAVEPTITFAPIVGSNPTSQPPATQVPTQLPTCTSFAGPTATGPTQALGAIVGPSPGLP